MRPPDVIAWYDRNTLTIQSPRWVTGHGAFKKVSLKKPKATEEDSVGDTTSVLGKWMDRKDGVTQLAAEGYELTDSRTQELVANLLVVLCSGDHAQPMIQVQASSASKA